MIRSANIDEGLVSPSLRLAIHQAEDGGYWAEFPAFPGVYAEGATLDEVRRESEAALARYFELRELRASEAAQGRSSSDEHGPIPVIADRADDLGVRMPLPARVREARASAAERIERALERLGDDPPGSDEALMAALDDRRGDPAFAGRAIGA